MSYLKINGLFKSYNKTSDGTAQYLDVLKNINLDVEKGEFVTFFGPNGCGKTTLLKVISNLEDFDKGQILFEGKNRRDLKVGFVFQNYAESLYPWRTNLDNVSFPLQLSGLSKKNSKEKSMEFLRQLEFTFDPNNYPYQLSGGQKQLVAIARGLIHKPDIFCMDEPFSSLDFQIRLEMQLKLLDIWEKTKITTLFVSHEIDESIFLADKVVVLSKCPASVIDIIPISLPRPRNRSIIKNQEFIKIKNKILDLFMTEIDKQ